MKIKKIILENIRSYKHEEIEFPSGSILLSGDIGSGKTSILLGIEFALFGLQTGQKGSSLLRNGENTGKVEIEFEIDGKSVLVERVLKRGKSVSQEDCFVTIDGERNETSVMELKSRILKLLEYPSEFSKKQNMLYKFTVYTPQEEMKQIILQDSETRINTLRNIFGIDRYKKVLENSLLLLSKIREERRFKENAVSDVDNDRIVLKSKENDLEMKQQNLFSVEKEFFILMQERKKIQEEKDEISKKITERDNLSRDIDRLKIMLIGKNDMISVNKKAILQLNSQIAEVKSIEFNESEILPLEEELKMKKRQKADFSDSLIKTSSEINFLNIKNHENAEIKNRISSVDICPTCLQEVDTMYKNNILSKINSGVFENLKKMEMLNSEKTAVQSKISEVDLEINFVEKKIQDYGIIRMKLRNIQEKKSRVLELEESNVKIEKDISNLKEKSAFLEKSIIDMEQFDSASLEKQKLFDEAAKKERMAEIKTAELKKEIEFFSRQILELSEKIKKMEETKKKLEYLSELENWISKKFSLIISTIERNVMIKLKREFSRLFSEWFSMLVSESFNVKLDDDFTPVVELQDYELDYSYLSGGERTAISLAYRLALNQVINSRLSKIKTKDIVILDEPTDGFSAQQLDKMRDVLLQLNVKQLIIVSHEQKMESFVDNVIRFKKVNGISVRENVEQKNL